MKLLVGFLSLLLIVAIYWNFFSEEEKLTKENIVTNSNQSEKKELNFEENKVSRKIINEEKTVKKTETVNYKDVFKEPKEMQTEVEEIVERDELNELDQEVKALISEADTLIEKNKLTLVKEEIPEDVKAAHEFKENELENKLNKLDTE
jgi:hypothetical protein